MQRQGFAIVGRLGGGASIVKAAGTEGLFLGGKGVYFYHWFEVGITATVLPSLFGETSLFSGTLVGARWAPSPWLRFELSGEAGLHGVQGIGNGLFSRTVGGQTSAEVGYAGGQLEASLALRRTHKLLLGGWFGMWSDLGHQTVHPMVESCFIFCSTNEETHRVGGAGWTTGVHIGGEITQ